MARLFDWRSVLRLAIGQPTAGRLLAQDIRHGGVARHERAFRLAEGELKGESNGAEERTRTFTVLLPPAPQAGASANSATSAWCRLRPCPLPYCRPSLRRRLDQLGRLWGQASDRHGRKAVPYFCSTGAGVWLAG